MKRKKRKKSRFIDKTIVFVFSVLLIPLTAALLLDFPVLFKAYNSLTPEMLFAAGGFLLFYIIFVLLGPPARSYILEHELSHMIFAFASGIKVKRASIRRDEGSIETERVNILIALVPYAFPLYSFICAGASRIVRLFISSTVVSALFYGAFGMSLSFHLVTTVHYMQIDQPDLRRYGAFASIVIIATLTLVILALLFGLIFENVKLFEYFTASGTHTVRLYERLYSALRALWTR